MSKELVLNSPTWMDTGEPVRDVIQLQNAAGLVTNVECTDEEPLALPRCTCHNAGAAAEDNVPPRRDPNYGDNDPATGYGVEVFGRAAPGASTPDGGEDVNADTHMDEDEKENARRARELRMKLGLEPFPGAPAKSFG